MCSKRPQKLQSEQQEDVIQLVLDGPDLKCDRVAGWYLQALCDYVLSDFRIVRHPRPAGRMLRRLSLCRRVSQRYHPKANVSARHFSNIKWTSLSIVRRNLNSRVVGTKIKIWIEEESHIGEESRMTRDWEEMETYPSTAGQLRRLPPTLRCVMHPAGSCRRHHRQPGEYRVHDGGQS